MATDNIRMKSLVAGLIMLSASLLANDSVNSDHEQVATASERAALAVVERRTAAYNRHDIEVFLSTYDENVRVYEYPDKLLGEGRERMRGIFGPQFAENDGRIVVHARHALENTVISDETTTVYGHTEHNIGIYTVRDGAIVEVRLVEPSEIG